MIPVFNLLQIINPGIPNAIGCQGSLYNLLQPIAFGIDYLKEIEYRDPNAIHCVCVCLNGIQGFQMQ